MPRHKAQLISMRTLKHAICDRYVKNKSMSIHHTETKSFWTTNATTKSFQSYTGIKSYSISYTEIKSIWTTYTKRKSICMLTKKHLIFAPHSKTKSSFDHPHSNQIEFILTLKSSQLRPPTLKSSQVGPPT